MFFQKTMQYSLVFSRYSRYILNDSIKKFPIINRTFYISPIRLEDSFVNNNFTGYIPVKDLDISYSTSSGPGGQNVNRINTKVTVKLHLPTAQWIPEDIRNRIQELHKNSISKEGHWIIRSDKTRQQMLNVADCMDKLRCFIAEAAKPIDIEPSFETLEKIRKQREKAAIKRLETKKHRSVLKAQKRIEF